MRSDAVQLRYKDGQAEEANAKGEEKSEPCHEIVQRLQCVRVAFISIASFDVEDIASEDLNETHDCRHYTRQHGVAEEE